MQCREHRKGMLLGKRAQKVSPLVVGQGSVLLAVTAQTKVARALNVKISHTGNERIIRSCCIISSRLIIVIGAPSTVIQIRQPLLPEVAVKKNVKTLKRFF